MTDTTTQRVRARRFRAVLSVAMGVIFIIGLIASVFAIWAKSVLFDSDVVASAAEAALDEPEVTDALATYLTDQILVAVNVDTLFENVLPPALQPLAPGLQGGVASFVHNRVEIALANETTRALIVGGVRTSHAALMRLLDGDGVMDGISVVDGEVAVNMLPLLARELTKLQGLGFLSDVDVPALTMDGDPDEQLASLEAALDRDLPDGFGQLVVYRSNALADGQQTLATAQQAVVLVRRSIVLVLIVTIVSLVASVLLASRRRRAILVLLIASIAAMIITRAVVNKVVAEAPTLVLQPGARATISATVTTLSRGLLTTVTLAAIVGAIAAIGLYLNGPSERAKAIRGRAGSTGGSMRDVVTTHRDAAALVAFGAALLVIVVAGFGIAQVLVALVLAAAGAWAMWAPGRATPPTPTP